MNGSPPGSKEVCATHSEVRAAYRCDGCGRLLCEDCVKVGTHLSFCGLCGELAVRLGEEAFPVLPEEDTGPPPPEDAEPPAAALPQTTYKPPLVPLRREKPPSLMAQAANHVVVPAATIAMVVALLFYLLDVRSVFLGDVRALKWIGFWFVFATVLIARFGKQYGRAERQGCYTFALGAATVLVMALSPWENPRAGIAGPISNGVIIFAVWHFASRLTRGLSLEGRRALRRPGPRLFGLERIHFETWRRRQPGGLGEDRKGPFDEIPARRRKKSEHRHPSVAVARLAIAALVLFALCEPVLLSGPALAGERAFVAMIVFLFATGVVLAAGSGVETLNRVRKLGGRVTESVVPVRIAVGTLTMVVILTVALAAPGIRFRGSGGLTPGWGGQPGQSVSSGGEEAGAGEPEGVAPGELDQGRQAVFNEQPESPAESRPTSPPLVAGGAAAFLSICSFLGRLLWIPFVICVAISGLVFLWRLWPLLAGQRARLASRWRAFLTRLRAAFRGRRRAAARRRGDPLRDLDALLGLAPRDAVLAAYARLLALFDDLGWQRPERLTPYEILTSLPVPYRHLRSPADELTALYVKAAYSTEAADAGDQERAVAALGQLQELVLGSPGRSSS